jgi:hypothetical protein
MALRLVALGDSTVEGLMDLGADGSYVGWADRFARRLAVGHPGTTYANLAVRGQTSTEVRASQLDRALSLRPDVVLPMPDMRRLAPLVAVLRGRIAALNEVTREAGSTYGASRPRWPRPTGSTPRSGAPSRRRRPRRG